jgi:hypothetical protein
MKSRLFSSRVLAGFGIACAVAVTSPVILQAVVGSPAYAEDEAKPGTVSPEVGKPLQAAQAAIKEKKYSEALSKLKEADAVAKKTPYEEGLIEQLRLIAAVGGEEPGTAAKAYDALSSAGTLNPQQKVQFAQAIAGAYFKAKEYQNSATWTGRYFQAGGTDLTMHSLLAQAYYLNNDFANTAKASNEAIEAYNKAGQQAPETLYQLVTSAATKSGDKKAYTAALEKLTAAYPKPDYWLDLVHQTANKPGVSGKLDLDLYRLEDNLGLLSKPNDYMEYAELAIQAGLPGEAQAVVDKGYKANVLGQGSEAERHGRLRDMAKRSVDADKPGLAAAETEAGKKADGTGLVNTGMDYYGYGQYDKALSLIQAGIAKGGLKNPDEAKLHLGIVQLAAGKKADAVATWKSMKPGEPATEIARLWLIKATGHVPA